MIYTIKSTVLRYLLFHDQYLSIKILEGYMYEDKKGRTHLLPISPYYKNQQN